VEASDLDRKIVHEQESDLHHSLGHEISERRLVPSRIDIGAIPKLLAAGKAMLPYRVKEA
jgi:hypothetical protein